MNSKWFVIINPSSGNGAAKKKWIPIYNELKKQQFNFDFSFTLQEMAQLRKSGFQFIMN